jgi:hypothetical protein
MGSGAMVESPRIVTAILIDKQPECVVPYYLWRFICMIKKTTKRPKSVVSVVFGAEPVIDADSINADNYNSVLAGALSWYGNYGGANTSSLVSTHKQWLNEWAKKNNIKQNTYTLPNEGIQTVASVAKLSMLGFPFNKKHVDYLKTAFAGFQAEKKATVAVKPVVAKGKSNINIADDEKLKPFLTHFDTIVDSIYDGASKWKIVSQGILSGVHGRELKAMYKDTLRELKEVQLGKNADLNEAYALSKVKVRRMIAAYTDIIQSIDDSMKIKKAQRKPRAKKVRMASDVVKKLKYLDSFPEFNLVSTDPAKVIGCTVAYTFDVRKRLLKKFTSDSTLDIKGQTLQNCTVLQKKIRRPTEQLVEFVTGTKLQANKAFDAIRAVAKETAARVNQDTIFLKAF